MKRFGAYPGICVNHTASSDYCANDNFVAYVEVPANPGADCVSFRDGSQLAPYCSITSALYDGRLVVRVAGGGTSPFPEVTWPDRSDAVLVVGKNQTKIVPSAASIPGLRAQYAGSKIFLRDLEFSGSTTYGIDIRGTDSVVHTEGVWSHHNQTGIYVGPGVAFDIRNTIVSDNSYTGISIATVPASPGMINRIEHVTVANNGGNNGTGIYCGSTRSFTSPPVGILSFGHFLDVEPTCEIPTCCSSSGSPLFTNTYRLQTASPCRDTVSATSSLLFDIDGDPRPRGAAADCGADEIK